MVAQVRTEQTVMFTEIGIHTDVEIALDWDKSGAMPLIHVGHDGHTMLTFADVESLERFAAVAAEGARQWHERIEVETRPAAASGEADLLVGAGAAQ